MQPIQPSRDRYDLVTVFEALHDMSYPVDVLRAARGMLAEGGVVLVGDERTAESFGAPGDDLERMYYGFSILHCLPVGMVGDGAVGTGTVMRPATVEAYARDAGFEDFEVAPIENDFWRFYLMRAVAKSEPDPLQGSLRPVRGQRSVGA